MKKFFDQLTALSVEKPGMEKAAENIKKDCQSKSQPNGNILEPVVESINSCCAPHRENETSHIEDVIKKHRAIDNPDIYTPVSPPDGEPLIRVVSIESFILYHWLGSSKNPDYTGKSFDSHSSMPNIKDYIIQELGREYGTIQLESNDLQGITGRSGEPTWWTFNESHLEMPSSGETYMKELALGDRELEKAARDNAVLEVLVKTLELDTNLYKPTALDAFAPNSRFEPELSGKPYGYTVPIELGLQPRPEIVSKSKLYKEFHIDSFITIKKFFYHEVIQ